MAKVITFKQKPATVTERFFKTDGRALIEGIDYKNNGSKIEFLTSKATIKFRDFIVSNYSVKKRT